MGSLFLKFFFSFLFLVLILAASRKSENVEAEEELRNNLGRRKREEVVPQFYGNILKDPFFSAKKRNSLFLLSHHQFHDGAGARAMRWLSAMLAASYFGIPNGFDGFQNGSGVSSIIEGDKYCHKYGELKSYGTFRCYENKWDNFLATTKHSVPIVKQPKCKLQDQSMSVQYIIAKEERREIIKLDQFSDLVSKTDFKLCDDGVTIGGTASITENLNKHHGFSTHIKEKIVEWQKDIRTFPRQGFENEPECMYSPDHINVAIHLRRGDKKRKYPVGKQNTNILDQMHTISQMINPELYRELIIDYNDEFVKRTWRKMGPPKNAKKRISFHIYTEAEECPVEVSHNAFLKNLQADQKDNYYFVRLKEKLAENDHVDLKSSIRKPKVSKFPQNGESGEIVRNETKYYMYGDLAMWDLEYQPCGYSYPVSCLDEYRCYGMNRFRCEYKYHCDSFPSGVWKVKVFDFFHSGRGQGYLPHEVFIHINGQPEIDVYCLSQADVIWSSTCSTFSQLALMISPLGKAIKIYSSDCKLPVERQPSVLVQAENRYHWHSTKNERVPKIQNTQKFKEDLKELRELPLDEGRKHRRAFQGFSPQKNSGSTTTEHLESHWMYWKNR